MDNESDAPPLESLSAREQWLAEREIDKLHEMYELEQPAPVPVVVKYPAEPELTGPGVPLPAPFAVPTARCAGPGGGASRVSAGALQRPSSLQATAPPGASDLCLQRALEHLLEGLGVRSVQIRAKGSGHHAA